MLEVTNVQRYLFPWLQVYLNWANSVLSGAGRDLCPGVGAVQEGKVICQLIDVLCPDADLLTKAEVRLDVIKNCRQAAIINMKLKD